MIASRKKPSTVWIFLLVAASGLASLSWEIIWQIKASLALGTSAWGAAITLAITMGGMCLGSFIAGRVLKNKNQTQPFDLYGILELVIGISGLSLGIMFRAIEAIDTSVYSATPDLAPAVYMAAIVAALIVPAICMGGTLPVFGLIARQYKTPLAMLYGINTLGAAAGALIVAFLFIPLFGITHTCYAIAAVNVAVAVFAPLLGRHMNFSSQQANRQKVKSQLNANVERLVVVVTGFATFALEIVWFRSFAAAFFSTTDAFAIMLAAVLVALGFAASFVPVLKKLKVPFGLLVSAAGVSVLLTTPVMERFDQFVFFDIQPAIMLPVSWFVLAFTAIGPSVFLLGLAFPWILDDQHEPRRWGTLYALNTLAAIIGSVGAAWLLLPMLGLACTAWLAGIVVTITGISLAPAKIRKYCAAAGIVALFLAVTQEASLGRTYIEGHFLYGQRYLNKILEYYEGPESTVSAIEYDNGGRALIVDGFITASQLAEDAKAVDSYMAWMGHLPMLLHPDPKNALVICFGTGQTANAVRQENPQSLDIVDINPRIFKLAHNFDANQDVLADPRVTPIVMDGRAFLRRTPKTYDIITLEPMPPNFAGVNALYSKEFYNLVRRRLTSNGIIAQWVPFHLVAPHYVASIVKTFQNAFPDAVLWLDPDSKTGILLGSKDGNTKLGTSWPGFARNLMSREYDVAKIKAAIFLNPDQLRRMGDFGEIISDDNQLLAYGRAVGLSHDYGHLKKRNLELLDEVKAGKSQPSAD